MRGGQFTEKVHAVGKVTVVTGGNTGIGLEIVKELNLRGAKVYMLCRSDHRAAVAKAELVESGCVSSRLHYVNCDLSSKENVRKCAEKLMKRWTPLVSETEPPEKPLQIEFERSVQFELFYPFTTGSWRERVEELRVELPPIQDEERKAIPTYDSVEIPRYSEGIVDRYNTTRQIDIVQRIVILDAVQMSDGIKQMTSASLLETMKPRESQHKIIITNRGRLQFTFNFYLFVTEKSDFIKSGIVSSVKKGFKFGHPVHITSNTGDIKRNITVVFKPDSKDMEFFNMSGKYQQVYSDTIQAKALKYCQKYGISLNDFRTALDSMASIGQ